MIRKAMLIVSLCLTTPLPASVKPCRDSAGKIVKCPRPDRSAKRCRDADGKFVPCPSAQSSAGDHSSTKK